MNAPTKLTPRLTTALALRDAAKRLLDSDGTIKATKAGDKERFWRSPEPGVLFAYYWGADIGSQHDPDWPHRLGVWHIYRRGEIEPPPSYGPGGCKVLSIVWRDNGEAILTMFRRGPWETMLLRLGSVRT